MEKIMNNKLSMLLLLVVATSFLPMISAADYTFPYSADAEFAISCDVDGVPCDASVNCSLTLRDPNNAYKLNSAAMSILANGDAYYLIPASDVVEIGPYTGKVHCSDGSISNVESFTLDINATGDDRGNSLFLILAIASLLVLGLAIIAENEYIGFAGGALLIVTGVYALIYGIGNLANLYTQAIAYVAMGLGFIFLVAAGYKAAEGNVSFSSRDDF